MAERQSATSLDKIRADHVARYRWALERLGGPAQVIDVGCGCGYGAAMLSATGHAVLGIDVDAATIRFARRHWPGPTYRVQNAAALATPGDAAVMFEVIEHLADPVPALLAARRSAARLYVSVPNEAVIPFDRAKFPFHHRHYRVGGIVAVLEATGWSVTGRWGQADKKSPVARAMDGRTIVLECR